MIPVYINLEWDLTAGICSHHLMVPPAKTFSIEMVTPQKWFPGCYINQNKFTTNIKHKNQFIVLEGHDIGAFIFDITIPFPNWWYAVMWPFSSREIMFSASTVKMNDKSTGCSQPFLVPLPMMTCGDPFSLPTSFPIINWLNTVKVGMTIMDFFIGLLSIALSLAIDSIFEYGGPLLKKFKNNRIAKKLGKEAAEKVLGKASKKAVKKATEKVIKETTEKVAKEAVEKATKEATEKLAKEVTEKVTKEAFEKSTKEAAEKAAKEASEKVIKEASKELSEKAVKETAEKAAKEASKKVMKEASEKLAKEASEKLAKEAADKIAKEATEKAAKEVSEKATAKAIKEAQEKVIKEVSEIAAVKEAMDIAKKMAEKTQKELFKEAAEKVGKETKKKALEEFNQHKVKTLAKEFGKKLVPIDTKSIAKTAVSEMANFATSSLQDNPTLKFKLVGGGVLPSLNYQFMGDEKDAGFNIKNSPHLGDSQSALHFK